MKITITMDLDDDFADPDHPRGLTEQGFEMLSGVLSEFGGDINIERAPEQTRVPDE